MHKSLKEMGDIWEKIQQDTQNPSDVIIIWISCLYNELLKNHNTHPLNIKIKNFADGSYIIRSVFCPYLEPKPFPEQSFPEESFPEQSFPEQSFLEQSSASHVKNLYFGSVCIMLTMLNIVCSTKILYFFLT